MALKSMDIFFTLYQYTFLNTSIYLKGTFPQKMGQELALNMNPPTVKFF